MQELNNLSDAEVLDRTKILCAKERLITAKLLLYISVFDDRKLYAKKAYPSMFQYLVSEMHYSEGAASRRVTSARLIKRYPHLYAMVESGAIHLSALHKLAAYVDRSDFMQLVEHAKGKSRRVVEEMLARITGEGPAQRESIRVFAVKKKAMLPLVTAIDSTPPALSTSPVDKVETKIAQQSLDFELNARISLAIDADTYADLLRAKEVSGHTALADVLKDALKVFLNKKDPKKKAERVKTADEKSEKKAHVEKKAHSRVPSAELKRQVYQRDGWQCVYRDAQTGKRCCATTNLHLDHRIPYAVGGLTSEQNLRILCAQHNRFEAERWFGRDRVKAKIDINKKSCVSS